MKILWLCNIILPEFCEEFGFKKSNAGGWLTGMWKELQKEKDIQLGILCPIKDWTKMRDGERLGIPYYSFPFSSSREDMDRQQECFAGVLEEFAPDIIHIWGTEFQHTLAMVQAAEQKEMLDRVVVNIQGLVSVYAKVYTMGIPEEILNLKGTNERSIMEGKRDFEMRGRAEREVLERVHHVIGRTAWDRACVSQINCEAAYWHCNEILRDKFYEYKGKWTYELCRKYSVFVSQAGYPVKGFHILTAALNILIKQYPMLHIYVAGANLMEREEPYARYISELIAKNRLEEHITFLGPLTEAEMCEQYRQANVFVSASAIENESNSIAEAKIIGTPVVASYVGGIESSMKHGEDGFVYPFHEEYMLAYYVGKIFDSKEIAEQFSKKGCTCMEKIIDKEANVQQNMAIYKAMLE